MTIQTEVSEILPHLGVTAPFNGPLVVHTPLTGEVIAQLPTITAADTTKAIAQAHAAFLEWRAVPAPKRGELIRLLGEELRANIDPLGPLRHQKTRQPPPEGPRGGPGDDRHLPLRPRPLPPARGPYRALR